jgi:putative FmdB family regulatory protein
VIAMPIYEFYCDDCHTVFNFLSRAPDTKKRPSCPRCGRARLERRVSRFAISKGREEPAAEDGLPEGFDEARLERAMAAMAQEVENVDEEDPRQMARVMRRLFDGAGLSVGAGMEEAIRRMEAGEDPDKIEEEMGDLLEGEDDPMMGLTGGERKLRSLRRKLLPPAVDRTLYEM